MGKLLEVEGERAAGKCHHPRGTEKYYFVICFSVDTSTPELASMESTCFASVIGVAFAANVEKERGREREREIEKTTERSNPLLRVQLGGNRARQASSGGPSASSIVHGYISSPKRISTCLFVASSR